LFCNTYTNDSEPTGLATHPPVTGPIEPVIVAADATTTPPATSPGIPESSCLAAGYSANSAFVCQAYADLLHRSPDQGGLATFVGLLNTGTSRTQVAYDIASSSEYRADLLSSYYEQYLGRAADPGALVWLGDLEHGASDQSVQAGILGSAEFYSDSGGAPAGFVSALYEDLLGRLPDPGGLASWVSQLAAGASRTAVAGGILDSNEYLSDLANGYYVSMLGRAADPGGLASAVNKLATGASDEAILAGIIGSAEFYTDATSA
jgi:hypothetical protein